MWSKFLAAVFAGVFLTQTAEAQELHCLTETVDFVLSPSSGSHSAAVYCFLGASLQVSDVATGTVRSRCEEEASVYVEERTEQSGRILEGCFKTKSSESRETFAAPKDNSSTVTGSTSHSRALKSALENMLIGNGGVNSIIAGPFD